VVIIFRKEIWRLIKSLKRVFKRDDLESEEYLRLLGLLLIGSVPAAIIGLLLDELIEKTFSSSLFVSVMLMLTGAFLWSTKFSKVQKSKLNFADAVFVGLAQAFALLPGISRSGFTIGAALFRGVRREKSAEFSFLLSLPAILGASVLKIKETLEEHPTFHEITLYFVSGLIAFLCGYMAIKFLLDVLRKGQFQKFGYYCLGVGILSLIFLG
jgi:undecaprenyl-diphosphatase